MSTSAELMQAEAEHCAHNYHPLPVVLSEGSGSWVTDVDGNRYLDLLSAYSALNFGHRHPALVAAAHAQLDRLTLTSRAFHNDQLAGLCEAVARLAGKDAVLPMNSGAEAVETAVKLARKWGHDSKGVPDGQAEIIVCGGNFHGRTTTIVSFSDDPMARAGFGPYTPGFVTVPFGDANALGAAITDRTVAFLVEPIQGEAGVVLPPDGYLAEAQGICREANVLLVCDEIQSGLGRTGTTFASEHDGVLPDVRIMGKALGGGIVPLSAVAADWDVMEVIHPGEHGSTFGGNPLAAAIGRAVVGLLTPGDLQERSAKLGRGVLERLRAADLPDVAEVRGRGLWWAIQFADGTRSGRAVCEGLLARGILAKDTHETTVRFAPPLNIDETDLWHAVDTIVEVVRAG